MSSLPRSESSGQALLLVVAVLAAAALAAVAIAAVAQGLGAAGREQRAADLGALAAARAMHERYDGLFEAPRLDGRPNPRHLDKAAYLARGREAARDTARLNGARSVRVDFPDQRTIAPVRVRVTVADPYAVGEGARRHEAPVVARAEAELAPPMELGLPEGADGGEYSGPLAYRQGKPMRPDVALAFDRLEKDARADGVALIVVSGYRSNAEQARLFAAHPDPKWVAPPGRSLHRLGTELDLGPPAAYGWLAANAPRHGFRKRYAWEPWHFGYVRSAGSRSVGFGPGDGRSGIPSFVPARFAPMISRAAQRWNVGAALLAAQLYAESNFNPFARSPAGAQGIAQFMPGTARAYGLHNPFDPEAAIDAQAHLMHDLLRQFASVPLALAAYNAGQGAVARCGCIPPYPETRGYVARILGLLKGAGDLGGLGSGSGLEVRLVE